MTHGEGGMIGFCTAGICVEMCSEEQPCGGEEMCCPNGCGHLCMAGVTEEEAEQIRQAQDNPSGATRAVPLLVVGMRMVSSVALAQPGELCCSNGCGKVCKVGVTQAEYDKLADFNKRSITGFSLMIDFNDNADLDEIAANLKSEKLGKIFPASTESPNVSILHALKMAIVKVKTSEREDADALEDFVKGIPAVSAATKSMEIEWDYAKDSAVVGRGGLRKPTLQRYDPHYPHPGPIWDARKHPPLPVDVGLDPFHGGYAASYRTQKNILYSATREHPQVFVNSQIVLAMVYSEAYRDLADTIKTIEEVCTNVLDDISNHFGMFDQLCQKVHRIAERASSRSPRSFKETLRRTASSTIGIVARGDRRFLITTAMTSSLTFSDTTRSTCLSSCDPDTRRRITEYASSSRRSVRDGSAGDVDIFLESLKTREQLRESQAKLQGNEMKSLTIESLRRGQKELQERATSLEKHRERLREVVDHLAGQLATKDASLRHKEVYKLTEHFEDLMASPRQQPRRDGPRRISTRAARSMTWAMLQRPRPWSAIVGRVTEMETAGSRAHEIIPVLNVKQCESEILTLKARNSSLEASNARLVSKARAAHYRGLEAKHYKHVDTAARTILQLKRQLEGEQKKREKQEAYIRRLERKLLEKTTRGSTDRSLSRGGRSLDAGAVIKIAAAELGVTTASDDTSMDVRSGLFSEGFDDPEAFDPRLSSDLAPLLEATDETTEPREGTGPLEQVLDRWEKAQREKREKLKNEPRARSSTPPLRKDRTGGSEDGLLGGVSASQRGGHDVKCSA
ncbi:WAP four-disulfide core domain 3 [Perkinsus olseni]|uniref:WAP four-disulfide core domain 3 n=1 Tax=Perkinsus olseni TaxID=32597 RepID=A0A7J6PC25_PEROL|nr:WAP four-disulfide core domain 3 [Perkinsus olseni]